MPEEQPRTDRILMEEFKKATDTLQGAFFAMLNRTQHAEKAREESHEVVSQLKAKLAADAETAKRLAIVEAGFTELSNENRELNDALNRERAASRTAIDALNKEVAKLTGDLEATNSLLDHLNEQVTSNKAGAPATRPPATTAMPSAKPRPAVTGPAKPIAAPEKIGLASYTKYDVSRISQELNTDRLVWIGRQPDLVDQTALESSKIVFFHGPGNWPAILDGRGRCVPGGRVELLQELTQALSAS